MREACGLDVNVKGEVKTYKGLPRLVAAEIDLTFLSDNSER
jgi:hypothetical protein